MSRTKHKNRRPPCSNWATRISTGKEVPSLRLWRVSKVTVSPARMRCFQALYGCLVETNVEIAWMLADQFFPAVAQTIAGLPVDVENGQIDRQAKRRRRSRDPRRCGSAPRLRAAWLISAVTTSDVVKNVAILTISSEHRCGMLNNGGAKK